MNAIRYKNALSGLTLLTILFCSVARLHAQTSAPDRMAESKQLLKDTLTPIHQQYERLNGAYIVTGIQDGLGIAASPLSWKKKEWISFAAVAGAAGGIMLFDKKIKSVFQSNQNNFTNSVAAGVEPIGSIYGMFVFPAIYVTGRAIKNPHVESIGLRGSKAMAISSVICFAGKNLIRRQRPDASASSFNYALPFAKAKYNSFPSAHSSIAFTLATAFAMEFPDKKWVAPVAYSIATLTTVSRVYNNRHWASDVLVGAALGHLVTKAVYTRGQKKHRPAKTFM